MPSHKKNHIGGLTSYNPILSMDTHECDYQYFMVTKVIIIIICVYKNPLRLKVRVFYQSWSSTIYNSNKNTM